jgi:hypothetical protein
MKIITQWFDAGTMEYVCRWHRLLQCVLACDKATEPFYRLVTDARQINIYESAWRVKNFTVAELCLILMPNSLMAVRDLMPAYHLVRYSAGGCRGDTRYLVRCVTYHSRTGYEARRTMQSGCGSDDCLGWCDKSLMAFCVCGHVGRFAAAQFGHKVSNTGLAVLTDAVVVYASEELSVDSGAYVDDFMHSIAVLRYLTNSLQAWRSVVRYAPRH